MEEYFHQWWAGNLQQYCTNTHLSIIGFSIPQINKLSMMMQYSFGLLGILEIVEQRFLMHQFRLAAFYYCYVRRFMLYLLNSWNIPLRLILGLYLVIVGELGIEEMSRRAVREHISDAKVHATHAAKRNLFVRLFEWLEEHPISERGRKVIMFWGLVGSSLLVLVTTP